MTKEQFSSATATTSSLMSCRNRTGLRASAVCATLAAAALGCSPALAQLGTTNVAPSPPGKLVPASSGSTTTSAGKTAHTNITLLNVFGAKPPTPKATAQELPPLSGYAYETPASLACVYGLAPVAGACNPNLTTVNPVGGSQSIAIVDAYDDPEAAADLALFSLQFGIPLSLNQFQVVYQSGPYFPPPLDYTGGWELEESLDIEYAHAMAPGATIYLVEANSNYNSDLYASAVIASNLVVCGQTTTCPAGSKGKGEVSMSFGEPEYSAETDDDANFTTPGVVYLAATGDEPGTSYPAVSPNVIAVGGSSIGRNPNTGAELYQLDWSETGGGLSYYEPIPPYQAMFPSIAKVAGAARATPDLSFDANPDSGVWVYDTFPLYEVEYNEGYENTSWFVVGGTSVATPSVAGIINAAAHFASSSASELTTIYANGPNGRYYRDITYGTCGFYLGYLSGAGYDLCSGVGTPVGLIGK